MKPVMPLSDCTVYQKKTLFMALNAEAYRYMIIKTMANVSAKRSRHIMRMEEICQR